MTQNGLVAAIVLSLACVLVPSWSAADDSARISQLELEIQRLRTRIDEQQRRIERLEEELNRRLGPGFVEPAPESRTDQGATAARSAGEASPWHAAKSWAQVTKGMSEAEVTEILGSPTSAESIGSLKTLFYRGEIVGVGAVSGIVNLRDGRVVAVNKPAL